jgi:hypothetical protein
MGFMGIADMLQARMGGGEVVGGRTNITLPDIWVKLPVQVYSYEPTIQQCDSTPFVTADGSTITESSYYRWCALSPDILRKYPSLMGQSVYLRRDDRPAGVRIKVHDTTHPDITGVIDIVVPVGTTDFKPGKGYIKFNRYAKK